MAQERYGFFNSTAEDERSYDSADMATAFHSLASNGVAALGTNLQVTAESGTMRTLVGYGTAMIQGYYYQLKDDGSGVRAFAHTTEAELARVDRIVLRLDLAARTIALVKRIGVASSTPAAPELTRSEETYEISLARVLIRAGACEVLSTDITDERDEDTVCGLIAPESLRRSEIVQLIADAIDAETGDVLRSCEQELEESAQAQVRTNIDAQRKITASGLLKGNGDGGVMEAEGGEDYGIPAVEVSATLASTSWSGSAAPYTQGVSVSGMTAAKKAFAGLPATATQAQYKAAAKAKLRVSSQGTDTVTVTAEGTKPTISIPILVTMVG
jgi:hypothetical protein